MFKRIAQSALQHTASVAAMFFIKETLVADIPKKGDDMLDMGGMGGEKPCQRKA